MDTCGVVSFMFRSVHLCMLVCSYLLELVHAWSLMRGWISFHLLQLVRLHASAYFSAKFMIGVKLMNTHAHELLEPLALSSGLRSKHAPCAFASFRVP